MLPSAPIRLKKLRKTMAAFLQLRRAEAFICIVTLLLATSPAHSELVASCNGDNELKAVKSSAKSFFRSRDVPIIIDNIISLKIGYNQVECSARLHTPTQNTYFPIVHYKSQIFSNGSQKIRVDVPLDTFLLDQ